MACHELIECHSLPGTIGHLALVIREVHDFPAFGDLMTRLR